MGDLINTLLSGDKIELTLRYWGLLPFAFIAVGVA